MAIRLEEADERDLVAAEARAARDGVEHPATRETYARLAAAAAAGEIPEELEGPLETLLLLGLETGRLRFVHGVPGETLGRRLHARTPGGRRLRERACEVNAALAALHGHTVAAVEVRSTGPGDHSLTLETDQARLTVEFDRDGARLRTVEVG